MLKTKHPAMTLVLGILLLLFSTAFAAAPNETSVSRTDSAPTTPQQLQAVWSGWSQVPGNGLTPSGPAATLLAFNLGNTLYLFIRGPDNKIYVNTFANGTTWSGWSEVPGNGFTPDVPGTSSFATSEFGAGQVNLFVRGTNNRIYVNILHVGS